MGALFAAADYASAIAALFPRGRVWPAADPTSEQGQVLAGLAQTPERVDAAAQQLLTDAFPATTQALLTEWEETLGLVQADAGLSTAARQAAIVAQLVAVLGQSQADMIAAAAALGATITIGLYAPARSGLVQCGQPLNGPAWAFAWSVHITANTGQLSSAQVLAALQAIAPAETLVFLN